MKTQEITMAFELLKEHLERERRLIYSLDGEGYTAENLFLADLGRAKLYTHLESLKNDFRELFGTIHAILKMDFAIAMFLTELYLSACALQYAAEKEIQPERNKLRLEGVEEALELAARFLPGDHFGKITFFDRLPQLT